MSEKIQLMYFQITITVQQMHIDYFLLSFQIVCYIYFTRIIVYLLKVRQLLHDSTSIAA